MGAFSPPYNWPNNKNSTSHKNNTDGNTIVHGTNFAFLPNYKTVG